MEHPDIRGLQEWRPLARGQDATVWQARQPALDRLVAVKTYRAAVREESRRAFLQVTARAARLGGHPGVLTVHDAGVLPDGRLYVVEELATGGSVADWSELPDRRGEEPVRELGAAVADALAAAHGAGVVHGAVKPANVLVDHYGAPLLADFGAGLVHTDPADTTARGQAGSGDPGHAPPEADGSVATAAGDVSSLAATLYLLLTGSPPPQTADGRSAGGRAARGRAAGRGAVCPLWDVDPALRSVLTAALDPDPAARPSAAELRDGLRSRTAPAGSTVLPASADRDRRRRRSAVLVAAAALAVAGSTGAWLVTSPASSTAPTAIPPAAAPAPASPEAGSSGGASTAAGVRIELAEPPGPVAPFAAVPIRGTHSGGPRTHFLRVQRWERGAWRTFPLPTRPDRTGRFTTYVELGQPGRYQLRVLDPEAGVASEPVLLVVEEA